MMQLARGEPLSLEYLVWSAPIVPSFSLRNTVETVGHLVTQHMPSSLTNDEFVRMTKYVMESFHDLLDGESESPYDSNSSRGCHHLSCECFMAGTPEEYVESIHEGEATTTNDLDDEVEGVVGAPPRLRVQQRKARHQELKEA